MVLSISVLALIGVGIGGYIGIPALYKFLDRRRFLSNFSGKQGVYLTFDDGPSPDGTPLVLDVLGQYGIEATFFVLGERAREYPELIDSIISSGHQVAFHGNSHTHPWKTSPCKIWRSVSKYDFSGISYFRPAFGKYDIFTLFFIKTNNIFSVFWNVDPRDYEYTSTSDSVASKLLEQVNSGSVVLLHDGRIKTGLSPVYVTAEALRQFLKSAAPRFEFKRLDKDFKS